MTSLLDKWNRDREHGFPLRHVLRTALRYLADLVFARWYLLGRNMRVGRLPRIRKRPLIRNGGELQIGDGFFLNSQFAQSHIVVEPGGKVAIGNQVIINFGAAISSKTGIRIGDGTHIGPHVIVMDTDYHTVGKGEPDGSERREQIDIGQDVWIASRVTILPGTTIGDGTVVSSGSVVSGVVPAGVVVGGNPARVLKEVGEPQAPAPATADLHQGLLQHVVSVVRDTLHVGQDLAAEASNEDVPGWDSLGHLRLVAALESAFQRSFAATEITRMTSIAAIVEVLHGEGGKTPPALSATSAVTRSAPQHQSLYGAVTPSLGAFRSWAGALTPATKSPLKIAVLRNFTIEPMLDVLRVELDRMGFDARIHVDDFDTIVPAVLDDNGALYSFEPDIIVVAQWFEAVAPTLVRRYLAVHDDVDAELERVLAHHRTIVDAIRGHSDAPIILNNAATTVSPSLGVYDSQSTDYQLGALQRLNDGLRQLCATSANVFLADYQQSAAHLGTDGFYSAKMWHLGKLPLTDAACIEVGRQYVRLIRALKGKGKKCLVLDCDNTLWGGVVGDEGALGVALGPDYPGSGYLDFHRELLELHDRGVILALCSKNNEEDALEVFRSNPHCLLKEEHFATWEINWQDKASNIRNLAARLNIGLDSMVFMDDSHFACELVRALVPEVEVIQIPKNPEDIAGIVTGSGLFDSLTYTPEDKTKNVMYRVGEERERMRQDSASLEDFLFSIGLRAQVDRAGESTVQRVAQLTQKTNQFNLTNRRYTPDDIRRLMASADHEVYCIRVADRLADFGTVGVAIVDLSSGDAEIDTFVMSCRVLGRGIETAFLHTILAQVQRTGDVAQAFGVYEPTAKNQQVAGFLRRCGFESKDANRWELNLDRPLFESPAWVTVAGAAEPAA